MYLLAKSFSSYEGLEVNKGILKPVEKCHFPTFQNLQLCQKRHNGWSLILEEMPFVL